jgi:hypothetical protein
MIVRTIESQITVGFNQIAVGSVAVGSIAVMVS